MLLRQLLCLSLCYCGSCFACVSAAAATALSVSLLLRQLRCLVSAAALFVVSICWCTSALRSHELLAGLRRVHRQYVMLVLLCCCCCCFCMWLLYEPTCLCLFL